MPKFDFACGKCDTVEERTLKFSEADQTQICDRCGSGLSKLFNAQNVGVVWNCSGSTGGFAGGSNIPKTPFVTNPGHREPRLGDLGLTNEDGAKLGIK